MRKGCNHFRSGPRGQGGNALVFTLALVVVAGIFATVIEQYILNKQAQLAEIANRGSLDDLRSFLKGSVNCAMTLGDLDPNCVPGTPVQTLDYGYSSTCCGGIPWYWNNYVLTAAAGTQFGKVKIRAICVNTGMTAANVARRNIAFQYLFVKPSGYGVGSETTWTNLFPATSPPVCNWINNGQTYGQWNVLTQIWGTGSHYLGAWP